jgi:hypothetical protein
VVVVVVPIALMCLMLILERLEERLLGAPAPADEELGRAAPSSRVQREIVAEPPKAA